jgi:hypothetical protein
MTGDYQWLRAALYQTSFSAGLLWFFLVVAVVMRLRSRHAEKLQSMGQRVLYILWSPQFSWAFFRFLIWRNHRVLHDPLLSILCDAALAAFAICLVTLAGDDVLSIAR